LLSRHAIRGFFHGLGVMLWFYAMSRIPIAEVTALGFTAPIFITIGAAVFLGERLRLRRITAVIISFAGALIILRPGLTIVDPGAWAQMIAAPLFAASMLMAKNMTRGENPTAIVTYMSIFVTLTLLPGAIFVWRPPTLEEYAWIFVLSSIATLGHLAMTQAYKNADITVTQPVTFLQLVWAVLLGYYVFDEAPDIWTIIGGMIIIAGATYIVHREASLKRKPN
jgi:drug/metabolite transporter (DMT)-like permease